MKAAMKTQARTMMNDHLLDYIHECQEFRLFEKELSEPRPHRISFGNQISLQQKPVGKTIRLGLRVF